MINLAVLEKIKLPKRGKPLSGETTYPTLVLDPYIGWDIEDLTEKHGDPWNYNGKWVYLVKRDKEGSYHIYDPYIMTPEEIEENRETKKEKEIAEIILPDELARAALWPERQVLFSQVNTRLAKVRTGLMIALVGVLIFFIYLIFSSMTGV
jgi:hypothetical protein